MIFPTSFAGCLGNVLHYRCSTQPINTKIKLYKVFLVHTAENVSVINKIMFSIYFFCSATFIEAQSNHSWIGILEEKKQGSWRLGIKGSLSNWFPCMKLRNLGEKHPTLPSRGWFYASSEVQKPGRLRYLLFPVKLSRRLLQRSKASGAHPI